MRVEQTALPEVLIVETRRFGDSRGFFTESWNRRVFADAGIDTDFVQDNHSYSRGVSVLRGLHAQSPPTAQDKLVRVLSGRIYDVVVDIRRDSPRFGQWVGVEISGENGLQLFVPKGFLHGFVTLEVETHVLYKTSGYYSAPDEISVRWSDPTLAIDWPIGATEPTLSDKDAAAPFFNELETPFSFP